MELGIGNKLASIALSADKKHDMTPKGHIKTFGKGALLGAVVTDTVFLGNTAREYFNASLNIKIVGKMKEAARNTAKAIGRTVSEGGFNKITGSGFRAGAIIAAKNVGIAGKNIIASKGLKYGAFGAAVAGTLALGTKAVSHIAAQNIKEKTEQVNSLASTQ